jgi:hypothetical protein
MSTELHESLAAAAKAGSASFELRDASEIIVPATRRVRRQKTTLAASATVGLLALAFGVVWTAQTIGTTSTMDPAGTSTASDVPAEKSAWSTLQFASAAVPRKIGDANRTNDVRGMLCHHDTPNDDPRVAMAQHPDLTVSHSMVIEDCAPVWFAPGPSTTGVIQSFSVDDGRTISARVTFRNTSAQPLAIDADSVVMWIETAPDTVSTETISSYANAMVGDSMWESNTSNVIVLDSRNSVQVIQPGDDFAVATTVSDLPGDESTLGSIVASGEPYTVSFWARVHEDEPSGRSTYLVQLGSPVTVNVRSAGR